MRLVQTLGFGALLFAASCAARRQTPVTGLTDELLAVDLAASVPVEPAIRNELATLRVDVEMCWDLDRERFRTCALERILGSGGLRPAHDGSSVAASTLSGTILERRGVCSALIAAVLVITERYILFDAVVFRDHVVLVSSDDPGRIFEVLERGRVLREEETARLRLPPGGVKQVDPGDYVAFYADNLAARLAEEGRYESAEALLARAQEILPTEERFFYNLGTLDLKLDRPEAALARLDRAIELGWNDADAWSNRGVALLELGRLEDAEESFRRALGLDPSHGEARRNLLSLVQR